MADQELLDREAIQAGLGSVQVRGQVDRSSVGTSLERLHSECESLHVLCSRLEDALGPFLKDDGQTAKLEPGAYSSPGASSTRNAIEGATLKLIEAERRLDALLDRIDA